MKCRIVLYMLIFLVFGNNCSLEKREKGFLACIDVRKNYPEKEIILTDIANVSYLHLNTEDNDYLYSGGIVCISKNTIVVYDNASGSFLFFSKDGLPKSRFNRKGIGPQDYSTIASVIYDEVKDELFVFLFMSDIQVYSSWGEHKRKIVLPQETVMSFSTFFDDQSIISYDASIQMQSSINKRFRPYDCSK